MGSKECFLCGIRMFFMRHKNVFLYGIRMFFMRHKNVFLYGIRMFFMRHKNVFLYGIGMFLCCIGMFLYGIGMFLYGIIMFFIWHMNVFIRVAKNEDVHIKYVLLILAGKLICRIFLEAIIYYRFSKYNSIRKKCFCKTEMFSMLV